MKRANKALVVLLFYFALSSTSPAYPQERVSLGATSGNLKILYDALEPAYREAGFLPEWHELPGARLFADLQSGRLDALVVGSGSMAEQFKASYTAIGFGGTALGYSRLYMYTRASDASRYSPDPKTWSGLTIGEIVDVGPSASFGFPKNVEGVTILTAPTYESLVRMLDSRRFDFIVSTQGGIEQDLLKTGLSGRIIRGKDTLLTVDYWHLVNTRFASRIPDLIKAIEARKPQIDEAINKLLNR